MAKYTPPSNREHPPSANGQKTSKVGGAHDCGPMNNHGGDNPSSMKNAVERPPNGIKTR